MEMLEMKLQTLETEYKTTKDANRRVLLSLRILTIKNQIYRLSIR